MNFYSILSMVGDICVGSVTFKITDIGYIPEQDRIVLYYMTEFESEPSYFLCDVETRKLFGKFMKDDLPASLVGRCFNLSVTFTDCDPARKDDYSDCSDDLQLAVTINGLTEVSADTVDF